MKTQKSVKLRFAKLFFIIPFFAFVEGLAQTPACPFTISNNSFCDILVDWEFVDATNTRICGANINLTAGQSVNVGASCCNNLFDVFVAVTDVYDANAGVYNNFAPSQPVNGNINTCASCPVTTATVNFPAVLCGSSLVLTWTSSGVTIQ